MAPTAPSGTLNHQALFIESLVLHLWDEGGEGLTYVYSTSIYLKAPRCLTEFSNFHIDII